MNTAEKLRMGRRGFILGSALFVLGCRGRDYFIEEPERFEVFQARPPRLQEVQSPEGFDTDYLTELFSKLQETRGTNRTRIDAIFKNLCLINGAPGMKLDESGYFITVAHVVLNNDQPVGPPVIHEIHTGLAYKATHLLFDEDKDTAIVYVPTGAPQKPVDNLQIKIADFEKEGDIWIFGMYKESRLAGSEPYILGTLRGRPAEELYWDNYVRIKGEKSFGGSSGGAVFNRSGELLGLNSGFYYPKGRIEGGREYYEGALISPIKNFIELV